MLILFLIPFLEYFFSLLSLLLSSDIFYLFFFLYNFFLTHLIFVVSFCSLFHLLMPLFLYFYFVLSAFSFPLKLYLHLFPFSISLISFPSPQHSTSFSSSSCSFASSFTPSFKSNYNNIQILNPKLQGCKLQTRKRKDREGGDKF